MPTTTTRKPAAKRAPSAASRTPDVIKLLTADHKEVKTLFKAYEKLVKNDASEEEKLGVAQEICTKLTAHATAEEELVYPAARDALPEPDLIDEATVEHASAKDLIAQLESMSPSDDLYDAKVKVLGEYIDHHVQEEENEMFPKLRKSGLDLQELGAAVAARKEELLSELQA